MPGTAKIAELAGGPAVFVINQGESRGDHNERTREALAILGKKHGIVTCPVTVMRRIAPRAIVRERPDRTRSVPWFKSGSRARSAREMDH